MKISHWNFIFLFMLVIYIFRGMIVCCMYNFFMGGGG
jgi:hypothetical protein